MFILNKDKRSILLSLIIGDGHLGDHPNKYKGKVYKMGQINIKHGIQQGDYLKWKTDIIASILNKEVNIKPCKSYVKALDKSYDQLRIQVNNKKFRSWKRMFYKDKNKQIGRMLKFTRHPAFTAAVWFMDDGSCTKNKPKDGYISSFTGLILYICDQDKENIQEILEWFKLHFNITPKLKYQAQTYKGIVKYFPKLFFNNQQSLQLYEYMRPYILQIPSMSMKFEKIEERRNRRDLQQPQVQFHNYEIVKT